MGSGYEALILADNPLGYWRLGEPSGTTATDEIAAHDGTYAGSPALAAAGAIASDADTAVTFDGTTGQYVKMSTYTTIPAPPISLEGWLKGTTAFTDTALCGWFSAAGILACQIYLLDQTNVRIGFETGNANVNRTINDGAWHHVVGTHDGTSARLYWDGALAVGPVTVSFAGGASLNPFKVGNYGADAGGNDSFPGTIDEVAVYGYELTPAQVYAHAEAGRLADPVYLPDYSASPKYKLRNYT